jgi:hypothetical protein
MWLDTRKLGKFESRDEEEKFTQARENQLREILRGPERKSRNSGDARATLKRIARILQTKSGNIHRLKFLVLRDT